MSLPGLDPRFQHPTYLVRRKVVELLHRAFEIEDPTGQVVLYCRMKAFKLKEDIRLYSDPERQREVLLIQARQILDFSAAYDVTDTASGRKVGVLKRKGLKSILRDEWLVMDADDHEIGLVQEASMLSAILTRLIHLIPQRYVCQLGDRTVCTFRQWFNPFIYKLTVDFTPDLAEQLDRRLGLAMAILLAAIEGRQQ